MSEDDSQEQEDGQKQAAYAAIIEWIFLRRYKKGALDVAFERDEIAEAARELHAKGKIKKPAIKNLGDVVYSFRHRRPLPGSILATQPKDRGWLILGEGDAKYRFHLSKLTHIRPTKGRSVIPLPNATPEIIVKYAQGDEQALLAEIRYNRLIDTFLRVTAYSLQSHLRTKIPNYGQIEIDELYTGIDKEGQHYVIPVQAKGPKDTLGAIQTIQDVTYCATPPTAAQLRKGRKDFSVLGCRPVSAQLVKDGDEEIIAMFLLGFDGSEVTIKEERHYKLVPAAEAPAKPSAGTSPKP